MPKIVDQDAYRSELVRGAIPLFSARGYGSVTMRQVASELGVSTGTLYHYFPSKQSLFEAAVWETVEGNVEAAVAALRAGMEEEGEDEALRVSVRELFAFLLMAETTLMSQFVVLVDYWRLDEIDHSTLAPVLRRAHETYAQVVAQLLGSEVEALGELVLSVLFNLLEMRWFHGEGFDHEPQLAMLERLVERERTPPA